MWLWSPSQNTLSYPPFLSWWWCEMVTCSCDEGKGGECLRHVARRRLLLTFRWYIRRRIVCFCRRWTTDKRSLGRWNHGWRGLYWLWKGKGEAAAVSSEFWLSYKRNSYFRRKKLWISLSFIQSENRPLCWENETDIFFPQFHDRFLSIHE